MLQSKTYTFDRRKSGVLGGRPYPPRNRITFQVAASGQWTLGSLFDAIRKKPTKQHSPKTFGADRVVSEQRASLPLPPTFQRLGPRLLVLLDPKHDRLVYLLSLDEQSSTYSVADQLRGLLKAAAAPYVHLMALPTELRAKLLLEFPGGQPIFTSVPLPEDLAAAFRERQEQQCDGERDFNNCDGHVGSRTDSSDLGEGVRSSGAPRWARGGVLELLYGRSVQHLSQVATIDASSRVNETLNDLEAPDDYCTYDQDFPDDVMSRRKALKGLMAWRKGASVRVARHRSGHTPYRFGWLIQGFNSIHQLSVVVATPNLILIRNNVDANLGIDILYQPEVLNGGEEGGGNWMGPAELRVESAGALPEGLEEGLSEILKAVGILNDGSDDHDRGDKGKADQSDEDSELATILSMFEEDGEDANDDADDGEDKVEAPGSEREEREMGAKEEQDNEDADALTPRALFASLKRNGPFRELVPGVFVRVVDAGAGRSMEDTTGDEGDEESQDEDDGEDEWDMADMVDVQLSPGPMGWTASVRVGRDGAGAGGDAAARRSALLESLKADVDYIHNIRRLEALWDKQAHEDTPLHPQPGLVPEEQQHDQGTTILSQSLLAIGEEGTNSVRAGSGSGTVGGTQGLEADWQQAERRAATRAASPGRGHLALPPGTGISAAAVAGAVPTDRLMRPPRRPSAAAATAVETEGGEDSSISRDLGNGHLEGEIDESSLTSTPASATGSFVGSTRVRREAAGESLNDGDAVSTPTVDDLTETLSADGETGSDRGAEGQGRAVRPTGRSRMVRRPRGRMRSGRQVPDPSNAVEETDTGEDTEEHAAISGSTSASSAPKEPVAGQGTAPSSDVGSSNSSSDADNVVAIPAYRHIRHIHNGSGTAAGTIHGSSAGSNADAGASAGNRAPWSSRTGPASPMPQSAGPSSGTGATGLPPEAAGYGALDLEQLAQFVLGRQASPEEVQDLARAVAQSAEVEEAFGGISSGQPHPLQQQQQHRPRGFGTEPRKHPWRRPGTQPPSLRETLNAVSRSRRSVVTPRRRRLRIPEEVVKLASARLSHGSQPLPRQHEEDMQLEKKVSAGFAPASPPPMEGRRLVSGLMLRRLGQKGPSVTGLSNVATANVSTPVSGQGKAHDLQQQNVSQEEITAAMVNAFHAAPQLKREAANALVNFIRGRRHPGQQGPGPRHPEGVQREVWSADVLRSRTGLPGLVRGRDAVVVLPQALLEATVGLWHEQEQQIMHEDYRVGRGGA